MKRRRLLACTGLGTIGSLAGCLGSAEPTESPNRADPNDSDEGNGRGDGDSDPPRIDGLSCPPYETTRDSAICSHTADVSDAPVTLEPSTDRAVLADGRPADEITLTLTNRSTRPITVNPASWTIRHNAGAEWEAFWQEYAITSHRTVPPNDAISWTFTEAVESVRRDPDLESGLYAAELGVPDPETDGEWIACIAFVRLGRGE